MDRPNPKISPKSLPIGNHSTPSQPYVPNTKSQQPHSPSLSPCYSLKGSPTHKLLGKETEGVSWERGKAGKKEGPKTESSNTPFFTLVSSACFPWHSRGPTTYFLNSDNETQNRSTRQRMPHKGSPALSLAQGELSSCVDVKRNKGLFRLLMPKDGAATDEFWYRGESGNIHSPSL